MTGTNTRTCNSSGSWNGSEPSCNIVGEKVIAFGIQLTLLLLHLFALKLTILCLFAPVYSSIVVYLPVDCGILSSISFGSVNTGGFTTDGTTATYFCDTGYNMTGTNTRTCDSSGSWDGSEPSCNIVGKKVIAFGTQLIVLFIHLFAL